MADLTDIFYGEDDLDFFNSFAFAMTILVMGLLAVYGYQPPFDLALVISALVFIPLILAAESLTEGNILQSSATPTQGATAYTLPQAAGALMGIGTGMSLSLYSAPMSSGGYLSSILTNQAAAVQAMFNNNLAPFAENFAIIAFTFLFFKFMHQAEYHEKLPFADNTSKLVLAVTAAVPGAIMFAFLHGVSTTPFFLKAFIVMLVLLTMLFGEEITESHLFPWGVTVGLTIGVHRVINVMQYGGYIKYYEALFTAQAPIIYISALILIFDALMYGLTAWAIGKSIASKGNTMQNFKQMFGHGENQ